MQGIALIESNERQTAYEKDEPRSVSVLLTTLKIWLKFGFTMLESSTPGNLQLAITIAGPFEYYDIGAELLSDEAEDVVKLIVQTLLPGMIGIPLEVRELALE